MPDTVRLVLLSDTHTLHDEMRIPDGDVLIHAGDLLNRGTLRELATAAEFLRSLPHRAKVLIAGNHDWCLQDDPALAEPMLEGITYLRDREAEVAGLRIYGSPWQPWFFGWAFNLRRGAEIRAKWDLIPSGLDVLVTHGPPLGFGDRVRRGERVGCADLLEAVRRTRPALHVFGHIHEDRGVFEEDGITYANACNCTLAYEPSQPPLVFDYDTAARRCTPVPTP